MDASTLNGAFTCDTIDDPDPSPPFMPMRASQELTGQAQGYLNNRKPFTAVTDWIDRLCTQRYAEEEYDGIPELVEAINLQATGPTEASRALRKKLKYSNVHGQKRALILLKALVENCGQRFQTTFANEQLVDRIKIMSQDQLVDASVRKLLMRVLLSWHQQFKDDPSMKMVAGLYHACGGGKKSEAQRKNEAAEVYRKLQEKQRIEAQIRSDRKAAEQLQKEEEKKSKLRGKKGGKRPSAAEINTIYCNQQSGCTNGASRWEAAETVRVSAFSDLYFMPTVVKQAQRSFLLPPAGNPWTRGCRIFTRRSLSVSDRHNSLWKGQRNRNRDGVKSSAWVLNHART